MYKFAFQKAKPTLAPGACSLPAAAPGEPRHRGGDHRQGQGRGESQVSLLGFLQFFTARYAPLLLDNC